MSNLHMKIGSNLGDILLDIAQNHIKQCDFDKAISTYTDSLHGFTKEYALMLLQNKAVLVVDEESQGMSLKDNPDLLSENEKNIYDWQLIVKNRLDSVESYKSIADNLSNNFRNVVARYINCGNILDYNISKIQNCKTHIAAKLIAGRKLPTDIVDPEQAMWDQLEKDVENNVADNDEKILYYIVKYREIINHLYNSYIKFAKSYDWLLNNHMIKRLPFVEDVMEGVLSILKEYSNTGIGYYHPICNSELYYFKEQIYEGICKTNYGLQYVLDGILEKNISDGYDAGWLSPTGEFYGGNGSTSDMIHLIIAEKISKHREWGLKIKENHNPDAWLETHGWIKIHHDNVYGSFNYKKEEPKEDFSNLYIPTDIQIKKICEYIDNVHNGQFYTEYPCFGKRTHRPDPITTYKLKQMDEIQLHKIFDIWE